VFPTHRADFRPAVLGKCASINRHSSDRTGGARPDKETLSIGSFVLPRLKSRPAPVIVSVPVPPSRPTRVLPLVAPFPNLTVPPVRVAVPVEPAPVPTVRVAAVFTSPVVTLKLPVPPFEPKMTSPWRSCRFRRFRHLLKCSNAPASPKRRSPVLKPSRPSVNTVTVPIPAGTQAGSSRRHPDYSR
jgi:hypothetical protein